MASNQDRIKQHYDQNNEDDRATSSRANGIEFRNTQMLLGEYITQESRVIELGCGTGYYGMAFADACRTYTGVDISPANIERFQEKIVAAGIKNVEAVVGDATSLPWISDSAFDVVLCLGPMYHLPRRERLSVFRECCRIANQGAILVFSYINSIGAYAGWCLNDEWRETYPNAKANESFLVNKVADDHPDVFFLTSPEEMEEDARENALMILKNCGLDFFFAQSAINTMSDEQFALFMELLDRMRSSPSCTGLADHALMICRK